MLIGVHSDEGAMGVVLNRPSEVTVGEAVPQLEEAVDESERVFVGGPVQPSSIVFLAEFLDPEPAGAARARADRLSRARRRARRALARRPARVRVFAGFAGWGEGQLEAEIDRRRLDRAAPRCPRTSSPSCPSELWSGVLTRKGGSYALIARMPPDPSVN